MYNVKILLICQKECNYSIETTIPFRSSYSLFDVVNFIKEKYRDIKIDVNKNELAYYKISDNQINFVHNIDQRLMDYSYFTDSVINKNNTLTLWMKQGFA